MNRILVILLSLISFKVEKIECRGGSADLPPGLYFVFAILGIIYYCFKCCRKLEPRDDTQINMATVAYQNVNTNDNMTTYYTVQEPNTNSTQPVATFMQPPSLVPGTLEQLPPLVPGTLEQLPTSPTGTLEQRPQLGFERLAQEVSSDIPPTYDETIEINEDLSKPPPYNPNFYK